MCHNVCGQLFRCRLTLLLGFCAACLNIPPVSGTALNQHDFNPQGTHDNVSLSMRFGRLERRGRLTEATAPHLRCTSTKGAWCLKFLEQQLVPWKPAPVGNRTCPHDCNGVGNCNADSGVCECPAGWTGAGCEVVQKRPCTNSLRNPASKLEEPRSHIGADKRDLNWLAPGGTMSRCAGICDDDIASCWCDKGPYSRINAPAGSPPGTPPLRRGRPMITPEFQPKTTEDGRPTGWGHINYEALFGPKGWCMVPQPHRSLSCIIDGLSGRYCDVEIEHFCIGQCSGHGTCNLGFCNCDVGYYGHDCSRQVAGALPAPSRIPTTPHLRAVVAQPAAAAHPPPAPTRRRPLIYVYDLPPIYNSKLLQYRIPSSWCVHRRYEGERNGSIHMGMWVYAVDQLLHELLDASAHRTFDPEEADYFYVPQYSSCFPFPILGWADFPWFHVPANEWQAPRIMHSSNMVLDVKRWIEANHPYWKRRGGRDHIFTFTHDEGACWAPTEVEPAIWLVHWGRKGMNHTSGTAYQSDNYNVEHISWRQPEGWLRNIRGHACYNPDKDLVIPSFKEPERYRRSPLLGAEPVERDILLFFRGDVGKQRLARYSRGVRQLIYKMSKDGGWREKHNVQVGDGRDVGGDYSTLLARSKFCLVAPGDGWSGRAEDCVLHGAIPVVIMDEADTVFETALEYAAFSVRLRQEQVPNILDILLAIPDRKLHLMQAHLGRVWHRFRYLQGPALLNEADKFVQLNSQAASKARRALSQSSDGSRSMSLFSDGSHSLPRNQSSTLSRLPKVFKGDPSVDDAFSTIMQWLHHMIPMTR